MKSGVFFLLAVFLFFSSPVSAIEISGADDPDFKSAVRAWLQDDDAASLPALAKLAHEGNTAARYLLSQIERTTHFASETDYLKSQDRKQRLALFRVPGGLSSTAWLNILKENDEELATVLISLKTLRYEKEQLLALLKLGEQRLAFKELIRHLQNGGYDILIGLYQENQLGIGERSYAWYSYVLDKAVTEEQRTKVFKAFNEDLEQSGIDSAIMTNWAYRYLTPKTDDLDKIRRYGSALFQPTRIYGRNKWSAAEAAKFHSWLASKAPTTENLTLPYIYCRQQCPKTVGQCMTGVMAMAGGYEGLRTYQTPLVNLISNDDYLVSPRAKASLSRRMQWQVTQIDFNKRYGISACLAEELSKN